MRDGFLRRLRSRALPLLLAAAALAAGLVGPLPAAQAKLDPLNVINVQIMRANILVVLDTSGSMSFRPEYSDWADMVGGDCYKGANCVTTPIYNTCTDGTTCAPPSTCLDGVSGCTSGVNSYCADGSRCLPGRLCGSGSSQSACPSTITTCRDGSSCGHLCTDGTSFCQVDGDCPQVHGTCGSSSSKRCLGYNTGSSSCSSASSCSSGSCRSDGRCRGPSSACTTAADCVGNATCESGRCYWTVPGGCNGNNANCQTCSTTCTNSTGTACSSNNDCPYVSNTCNLTTTACPSSSGSTTCGYWCSDGTQCSAVQSYCASGTGVISSCTQVCNDGGSCYGSTHCGTGSCPSGSNVYLGSSRLAIAKHAIMDVMDATKNVANYGFMTFGQSGYFPYQSTAGSTTITKVKYFGWGELSRAGGWDNANQKPRAQFTSGGVTYTIECAGGGASYTFSPCTAIGTSTDSGALPAGNSFYDRRHSPGTRIDYCGTRCRSGGHSWQYQGSYYTFTQTITTNSTFSFQSTYLGPTATISGTSYAYYQFPWNYAAGAWPQNSSGTHYVVTGQCNDANGDALVCGEDTSSGSCSDTNRDDGVRRVDVSLSDVQSDQDAQVALVNKWLAPQNAGGVVARSGTPTGCTLQYASSGTTTPNTRDAYSSMSALKASDAAAACRKNAVLLVTDGEPNGPGDDSTCGDVSRCGTDTLSGCSCKSVLAAAHMLADLGVKTYAVGFGGQTVGSTTLDNIAKAGGSPRRDDGHYAYYAMNESDLIDSLSAAVYNAVKGDYATSAPTVATSSTAGAAGDYALLASSEFPSFRGHLRAFQTVDSTGAAINPPTQIWDAGTKLAARTWNTRKVYTSNSSNAVVPFVDGSGNANAAALYALGLGASSTEAGTIIQWTLGSGRPWPLGALLNSTPVTHGKGIDINLPGHAAYQAANATNRPKMVYVGADDGMLHAFYLETGTWGNAGDEAWAYVPPDLLPTLSALWVNGGQSSNPATHIYGVNSSPKVSDVCSGSCASQSDWKTILVSGEGPGGKGYFALDISAAPNAGTPIGVLWTSAYVTAFANYLGQSWSVPAFAFVGSPLQSILLFGSGYDVDAADTNDQGAYLQLVNALTGAAYGTAPYHLAAPSGQVVTYAVVADTALAIDATSLSPIAAYQADLGGRIWRLNNGSAAPGGSPLLNSGVKHPYYYSPSVAVQSGRTVYVAAADSTTDDPEANTSTSSTADDDLPKATLFKDNDGTKVDMTIRGANGTTYTNSVPLKYLCVTGCISGTCSCSSTANRFDYRARPAASPLLLRNLDSLASASVQAMFLVYQPPTTACTQGHSYIVVLDVTDVPVTQSYTIDAGAGKAAGLFVGGGGQLIVAKSGSGTGAASLAVVTTLQAQPVTGSTTPTARVVGLVEKDD